MLLYIVLAIIAATAVFTIVMSRYFAETPQEIAAREENAKKQMLSRMVGDKLPLN